MRVFLSSFFVFLLTGCVQFRTELLDSTEPLGLLLTLGLIDIGPTDRFLAFTSTNTVLESRGDGTWSSSTYTSGIPITNAAHVLSSNGSSIFYGAGLGGPNDTIFSSTNYGRSWAALTVTGGTLNAIAKVTACGTTIATLDSGGATAVQTRVSTNSGSTWTALAQPTGGAPILGDIKCNNTGRIFASGGASGVNVIRFADGGGSWTTGTNIALVFTAIASADSVVVAMRDNGTSLEYVRSVDSGGDYSGVTTITGQRFYGALAYANKTYVSATANASDCTFRTAPDGVTWAHASVPCPSGTSYKLNTAGGGRSRNGGNVLFVGGCNDSTTCTTGKIFRSTNGGASWVEETLPGAPAEITAIVTYPDPETKRSN